MSSFDLSQICKIAGEALTLFLLVKASQEDVRTRTVANKFPILIAVVFALSAAGQMYFMPETMPLTSIATQVVFAVGIGILFLVVTVGLEKVQHKELFGGGDIKVVAATTLFLSAESLLAAMLIACVLMILGALFKKAKGESFTEIVLPFVPLWTAGFMIAVVLTYVF